MSVSSRDKRMGLGGGEDRRMEGSILMQTSSLSAVIGKYKGRGKQEDLGLQI